jgi:hypothetical protein
MGYTPGYIRGITGATPSESAACEKGARGKTVCRTQGKADRALLESAAKSKSHGNQAGAMPEDSRDNAVAGRTSLGRLDDVARAWGAERLSGYPGKPPQGPWAAAARVGLATAKTAGTGGYIARNESVSVNDKVILAPGPQMTVSMTDTIPKTPLHLDFPFILS